jgi:hypothetical protein
MVKTLELAMAKLAELPEPAQEALGRNLLRQIDALAELRADIEVGVRELEAGLGRPLDLDALLKELHEEHAGKG